MSFAHTGVVLARQWCGGMLQLDKRHIFFALYCFVVKPTLIFFFNGIVRVVSSMKECEETE